MALRSFSAPKAPKKFFFDPLSTRYNGISKRVSKVHIFEFSEKLSIKSTQNQGGGPPPNSSLSDTLIQNRQNSKLPQRVLKRPFNDGNDSSEVVTLIFSWWSRQLLTDIETFQSWPKQFHAFSNDYFREMIEKLLPFLSFLNVKLWESGYIFSNFGKLLNYKCRYKQSDFSLDIEGPGNLLDCDLQTSNVTA